MSETTSAPPLPGMPGYKAPARPTAADLAASPPLPGMPGYVSSSTRGHLVHYAVPAGALIVALIALYLLRKPLKRLWKYATNNKPKVVWWITAVIIALQLFNPPNLPWSPSVIGEHIDSFQLLVRIIGITILGFIVANQVK